MKLSNFSEWRPWKKRDIFREKLKFPGVYALAVSSKDLSNRPFSLIEEIKYVGMTNSHGGLFARLRQFDDTIKGRIGHGGAARFLYKYKNKNSLLNDLYVSINYLKCDVKSNKSEDLYKMGEVVKFEYVCFAEYVKKFHKLPEFNDKKRSPERKRITKHFVGLLK